MNINKKKMCVIAPAKLNLNLKVLNKDIDGYHFLESHVCFLNLYDYIYISRSKVDNISQIKSKSLFVLNDETILSKTLDLFKKKFHWKQNFKVKFIKNIPIGAGLGGGSADSAALLLGLRAMFNQQNSSNKKIQLKDILDLGFLLGSDIPSCIYSKSSIIGLKGEKISITKTPKKFQFLLIYPRIKLSTRKVFQSFINYNHLSPSIIKLSENIEIFNSLQASACKIEPEINNVINILKSLKNIKSYGMTGSGSTCFGIFSNINDLKYALKNLKKYKNYFIWHGTKKEFGFNRVLY